MPNDFPLSGIWTGSPWSWQRNWGNLSKLCWCSRDVHGSPCRERIWNSPSGTSWLTCWHRHCYWRIIYPLISRLRSPENGCLIFLNRGCVGSSHPWSGALVLLEFLYGEAARYSGSSKRTPKSGIRARSHSRIPHEMATSNGGVDPCAGWA